MAGHRLIIDANIFLEALLKQERAEECALFLGKLSEGDHEAAITAFSLFAVAIRLERAGKRNALVSFFSDCERAEYAIYQPSFANQQASIEVCSRTGLDFDDAQQYVAAKELDAILVSLDKDFDKTDLKRLEPKDLLQN